MRDILVLPDKRLRAVSKPVATIDADVRKLIEEFSKSHPHLGPIREEVLELPKAAGVLGAR